MAAIYEEGVAATGAMRVRILDSALADLDRGRIFYEGQKDGLGDYFLDAMFAEIDLTPYDEPQPERPANGIPWHVSLMGDVG